MTLDSGQVFQSAVYIAGGHDWPLTPVEWEERARATLEPAAFDYVAGGAGSEATMRENLAAFERARLRPRMLVGTAERDLSVEILGLRSPVPFLLAPVGTLSIVHAEADLAVARAAAATGVPMVLSGAASTSVEDVADENPLRWFQLYWFGDRDVTASVVARVEAAGYGAVVVTVDTLAMGWRDRDLRNGFLPFLSGQGLAHVYSDPVFRSQLDSPPDADPLAAAARALAAFPNLGLTWSDLEWLRERTTLPILIKGLVRGDDARLALEHGAAGVVVSNHGGRQLDGSVAALDALVDVRQTIGPDATVLMDSGIRRGTDVLKALALGADAVLVGRPYVWGLAVGGREGVEAVIRQLAAEVDLAFALAGVRSVTDVDGSLVAR